LYYIIFNLSDSKVSEIDALLSELNELQHSLDTTKTNGHDENLILNDASANNGIFHRKPNHEEDIEAIDQQFDEVLKFLAQTIDIEHKSNEAGSKASIPNGSHDASTISRNETPHLSSISPSSISLSTTNQAYEGHIENTLNQNKDRSSGSSNSSGIGEDLNDGLINNNSSNCFIINETSIGREQQTQLRIQANKKPNEVLSQNGNNSPRKLTNGKRNSSDSAYLDTVSMPSSLSLAAINSNNSIANYSKVNIDETKNVLNNRYNSLEKNL
jgi:hypothetical protein